MKILKYANGFVRIKIWGNGAERFFVLCSRKQMYLWEIEAKDKYIYANIQLHDFYQCKKLAKKAGIRAVVVERHGLPFFIPKILNRSFFLVGVLLFVIGWIISANMLLHIEINGNYTITDDMFTDFLQEEGIHYGMWIKNVPLEELEKKIRRKFDVITWTSGRIDGTVLIIDLKENEKPEVGPKTENSEYGRSLYATMDGIIHSIYVRNGIPMAKKGMVIKKGDLLVDGRVPVYNQAGELVTYHYYDADADIRIETTIPVYFSLDAIYIDKEYTGRANEGNFLLFQNKIYRNVLPEKKFSKKDVSFSTKYMFRFSNVAIGFGKYKVEEYVEIERAYTQAEAKNLLEQQFEKNNTLLLEKGVQILSKDVTIDLIMGQWTLKGKMSVIMPAFETRPNEILEARDDSKSI